MIESDVYRREQEALETDPIIIEMVEELQRVAPALRPNTQSWDFATLALGEYERRGGKNSETIGGVGRTIHALLTG